MTKHFKLTDETKTNELGIVLRRIEATEDLPMHHVQKGRVGGWVSDEARVSGEAWVSDEAQVSGEARVSGEAWVSGKAQVSGEAWVSGKARVSEKIENWPMDDIPEVKNLDQRMAENVDSLAMDTWHTCETTHCRAGWAIHFAGEAGYELEKKLGAWLAGALIYQKSTGRKEVPNFFESNEMAKADILACAAAALEGGQK